MKKNFFKKLSFVMALAMIVSVIAPAAGAFAATSPKLSASTKYLFLGQDGKEEYDFNITNKKTGWKFAWTSSNEKVAVVAKNGLTTAKKTGNSDISVVITNAAGEEVTELTAKVIVKDNIKTLTIVAPTATSYAVGTDYDFNRSYVTDSGKTTGTTAVTKWTVSGNATISSTGVFKAAEAGKYTVTAKAFQSGAKYKAWLALNDATATANVLATATYEVTVVSSMVKAAQVDVNEAAVTFDSATADAEKNISIYKLVGTTKVKQTIKDVDMDTTNKVATIELYVNFDDETTYVVDYPNMKSVQFVTSDTDVEDVASIALSITKVTTGTPTDLTVKLLNKDGVDIATTDLLNRVTFSLDSAKGYYSSSDKELTLFTKGDTATITATFHTYNYTNGVEATYTNSGVVTAVDSTTVYGPTAAWTITSGTSAAPDFEDVVHTVAAEDNGYYLYTKLNVTLDGEDQTDISNSLGSAEAGDFSFTSSDTSVLIVGTSGDLHPIKAGSAVVVISYDDTVIDAITITVTAERDATVFKASTNSFTLSNSVTAGETKDVDFTLVDQLGDDYDFTLTNASIEKIAGTSNIVSLSADVTNTDGDAATLTFSGAPAGVAAAVGTYSYKITSNDLVQYITITVTAPTVQTYPSNYKLALSSTSADLKLTDDDTLTLNVDFYGLASNGQKMTAELINAGTSTPSLALGAQPVVVTVTDPDGVETTLTSTGDFALTTLSGSSIVKVDKGTYKVTAKVGTVAKDTTYFTVTDTQVTPVVAEVDSLYTTSTDALTAITDCFDFALDGDAIADGQILLGEVIGSGSKIFIKNVLYRETIANGHYFEHEITVGYTINNTDGNAFINY